ncbi:MAG: hypothetical protein KBF32_09075 [Chitinophagales bacterium]|nr:hypothetical protein [Chitinophagales bacterium]
MNELQKKHLEAIEQYVDSNHPQSEIFGQGNAAKECTKITLEYCIDVLNECMQTMKDAGYNKHINATFIPEATIVGLKKQLSDP